MLYASAYGNTAGMAQAISRGITKAGIGVETLNLEEDSVDDALAAVKEAKGFIIGSPTLGGHLPTQVDGQTHLVVATMLQGFVEQAIEVMTEQIREEQTDVGSLTPPVMSMQLTG